MEMSAQQPMMSLRTTYHPTLLLLVPDYERKSPPLEQIERYGSLCDESLT
jgi:hypothetical protein